VAIASSSDKLNPTEALPNGGEFEDENDEHCWLCDESLGTAYLVAVLAVVCRSIVLHRARTV
jgi:hypothetical protein